jgi:hypothetical protein
MNILYCREPNTDRCSVNLGHGYAGYLSIESFVRDSEKLEPLIQEAGVLYSEDDKEELIEQWKLIGHEVHYPASESRYDAVVILFYEPVTISVPVAS